MNECFTVWSSRLDLIPNADGHHRRRPRRSSTGATRSRRSCTRSWTRCRRASTPARRRSSRRRRTCRSTTACRRRPSATCCRTSTRTATWSPCCTPPRPASRSTSTTRSSRCCPDPDEIVIMPGSVLTALSGGKIPPLYHQVRNHGLDDRQSLMYFVNPEVDEPLFSWIDTPDGTRERHPRARAERALDVRPAAGRGAVARTSRVVRASRGNIRTTHGQLRQDGELVERRRGRRRSAPVAGRDVLLDLLAATSRRRSRSPPRAARPARRSRRRAA